MANWQPRAMRPHLRMRYLTLLLSLLTRLHSLFSVQPLDGQLQPLVKASLLHGSSVRLDRVPMSPPSSSLLSSYQHAIDMARVVTRHGQMRA